MNDSSLTVDFLVYHHPDALTLSIQKWHDTKTGVIANIPLGCFAYKRIDQTMEDPV